VFIKNISILSLFVYLTLSLSLSSLAHAQSTNGSVNSQRLERAINSLLEDDVDAALEIVSDPMSPKIDKVTILSLLAEYLENKEADDTVFNVHMKIVSIVLMDKNKTDFGSDLSFSVCNSFDYVASKYHQTQELTTAMKVYTLLIGRCAQYTDPSIRAIVARAFLNRGTAFYSDEKTKLFAQLDFVNLITEYEYDNDELTRERVAKGYFNLAKTYLEEGLFEMALETIDKGIEKFKYAPEISIKQQVSMLNYSKGVVFESLNDSDNAISAYWGLVTEYNDSDNEIIQEQVAKSKFNVANLLVKDAQRDKAIVLFQGVFERYKDSKNPALKQISTDARTRLKPNK